MPILKGKQNVHDFDSEQKVLRWRINNTLMFSACILFTLSFHFPRTLNMHRTTSNDDVDRDCIFRNSSLYRKIYVYPSPGDPEWFGDILSPAGRNLSNLLNWPWLEIDRVSREKSKGLYNVFSMENVQFTTELLVRELMVNKNSCLRTMDPEKASLFYVPYLPSTAHHIGTDNSFERTFSPFAKAIVDILDKKKYNGWENIFGLTSKYWKRRNGSDHILTFSEPFHGYYYKVNQHGNYHYVYSQRQLAPPIVISVELSTTFVSMYPKCASKNILLPYPNSNGDWFNGVNAKSALKLKEELHLLESTNLNTSMPSAALPVERHLAATYNVSARPLSQYYAAGNHGTCKQLRQVLESNYNSCALSSKVIRKTLRSPHYSVAMRLATFCPAPGGDSPSAKRVFDALHAGCIPIILSEDFVWPASKEIDPLLTLDPADFSIRLNASDFDSALLDPKTCQPLNERKPGLQAYLETIPVTELERLRQGVAMAANLYSWYAPSDTLPQNPLREGVLPNGGAAFFLIEALSQRAEGKRWLDCELELKIPRGPDVSEFKC